jgi:hypothetical protein
MAVTGGWYFRKNLLKGCHSSSSKLVQTPDCPRHSWHTLTKHNRTLARLGNLLYNQPLFTIKVNRFFMSLLLSKLINKINIAPH